MRSHPYRGQDALHCDTGLVHIGWACSYPLCTHSRCTKVFIHDLRATGPRNPEYVRDFWARIPGR